MLPPANEIHFLNRGALFNSHPVTPPNIKSGEIVVPIPNNTANDMLPRGVENGKA